jgi:hypothetical protein
MCVFPVFSILQCCQLPIVGGRKISQKGPNKKWSGRTNLGRILADFEQKGSNFYFTYPYSREVQDILPIIFPLTQKTVFFQIFSKSENYWGTEFCPQRPNFCPGLAAEKFSKELARLASCLSLSLGHGRIWPRNSKDFAFEEK